MHLNFGLIRGENTKLLGQRLKFQVFDVRISVHVLVDVLTNKTRQTDFLERQGLQSFSLCDWRSVLVEFLPLAVADAGSLLFDLLKSFVVGPVLRITIRICPESLHGLDLFLKACLGKLQVADLCQKQPVHVVTPARIFEINLPPV